MNFATGGDATLGTDYTLRAGGTALTGNSVTIAAGQSYVDVILAVIISSTNKPSETATLTIQGGTGYQTGVSSGASISIAENDVFSLSVSAVVSQASEPATNGTFRITRTGDTSGPLTVNFTMGGTGIQCTDPADASTSDYELETDWAAGGGGTLVTNNSVTILAGQSSIDVTLVVIDNSTGNFLRTATMTLTDGTTVPSSATITIADDNSHWQTILPDDLYSAAGQPVSIPVQYVTSTNDATLSELG